MRSIPGMNSMSVTPNCSSTWSKLAMKLEKTLTRNGALAITAGAILSAARISITALRLLPDFRCAKEDIFITIASWVGMYVYRPRVTNPGRRCKSRNVNKIKVVEMTSHSTEAKTKALVWDLPNSYSDECRNRFYKSKYRRHNSTYAMLMDIHKWWQFSIAVFCEPNFTHGVFF